MFKVLRQTLSMPQSQIETDIMFDAIKQICLLLETLYLETTKMNTSKYAKKRIKVDIKVFLKNCDAESDKSLKLTKVFKQCHFNLLIQEDLKTIQ
mgnify:CR=1 FL=1